MGKRGISPVIATILLIALVIVIGLIIFLWFKGFQEEAITKFGGENVKLICEDVAFESSYSAGVLSLSNLGNVPIYQIKAKISKDGTHETINLNDVSDWPAKGLTLGSVYSADLSSEFSGATEVTLIPVLRGTSEKGDRTYTCDEQYGKKISL